MKRIICFICILLMTALGDSSAQPVQSDPMPLADVLKILEQRFSVSISYKPEQVEGRFVDYAPWRMRGNIYRSLTGVLSPLGIGWYNSYGTNRFKLTEFEYYRWSVDEGVDFMRSLEAAVPNSKAWEERRVQIKENIISALRIDQLPDDIPLREPIWGDWRVMDGYKAANIAFEALPGYYVCGTVYMPSGNEEMLPVVLCPNGHWEGGRYREDQQYRCASIARMGAIAVSYDLFAWGEGLLQFREEDHREPMSMTFQIISSLRLMDLMTALPQAASERVAVTGGSGAGSHTIQLAAIDERIGVSIPVVSLSCHFFGGCPCESGMPIHVRDGHMFTSNVEIAALAAPRPMLVVSDGADWTYKVPEIEYPALRRIYDMYCAGELVANAHFEDERHDYGMSKRTVVYGFLAEHMGLDIGRITDVQGQVDESFVSIEPVKDMLSFGERGEKLPDNALKSFEELMSVFGRLTMEKQK